MKQSIRTIATMVVALLAIALALPARAAFNNATPRGSFAGHIDYVATGGTLRTSDTNTCAVTTSSNGTLSGIPAGATIVKAYLYWGGSGPNNDPTVTFEGGTVNALANFSDVDVDGYEFFGHVADVTAAATAQRNGTYTFSGLSVATGTAGGFDYCSISLVQAGWALVVIYEEASEPNRVINVYDGLQSFWGQQIVTTPGNFLIPASPVNGKTTIVTWEGDTANSGTRNGLSERVTFNGSNLIDNPCNPNAGIYNSTINCGGIGAGFGVDVDTYSIGAFLSPGQTSGTLVYSSGADQVYLAAQVVSTTNAPVADLSITKSHTGDFTAGSNGTYTLQVHNNGPEATSGTTTVTDTLPTGLDFVSATGTGWSCGEAGGVVTCTTNAVVADGANFNPITLTVGATAAGGASVVNSATVSGALFDNVPSNDSDSDTTTILFSDLSTSTKTVSDLNGPDAEANDVLRYTITLTETAGVAATGVSVVDNLEADLGNLSVVGIPPGSSDASSSSQLNITGITVPANGSVQIVFDATISGSVGQGDEIDNSATITNPNGTGAIAVAETVTVLESDIPQSGAKYLYLRNDGSFTSRLSRQRPTANGNYVQIEGQNGYDSDDWELLPAIPDGETLVLPAGIISGSILMQASGNSTGSNRTVRMTLRTSSGVDLGSNVDHSVSGTGIVQYAYNFDLSGESLADRTLDPGESLILRIENRTYSWLATNRDIRVHQRSGTTWPTNYSFLAFDTSTVINVDAIAVHSQPASSGNGTKAAYVQGDHAYIRATVSDPFGTADISDVSIVVKDPTGATIASGAMTPLADTNTSDGSLSYEYDFTVPANPNLGPWTATVTAKEGVEDLVEDTANVGFTVHGRVLLGKTWGTGAIGGNAVTLSIAGGATATAGTSTAGGSTTQAIATAAEGATLTLTEAFTIGDAGRYNISLACARDKDSVVLPVSGTGLSRTITMPGDSAVTCTWSNTLTVPLTVVKLATVYSDPVNGTTNPKAIPGALVTYLIIVTAPAETQVDEDAIVVSDSIPDETALFVEDLPDVAGTSPIGWLPNGSNLTMTFSGLGAADDVEFSDDDGATWDYEPVPDADGVDEAVTDVRIRPRGAFAPGQNFWVGFRVKIR